MSSLLAWRDFPVDLDQFDEAVDAEVGEGHNAFVCEAQHPDEAVLGLHFNGDVEEEVDVLAEVFGDAVDGPDAGDLVDVHGSGREGGDGWRLRPAISTAAVHRAGARDGRRCARGRPRATPAVRRRSSYRSR